MKILNRFHSKAILQQHVKYGNNWMFFYYYIFLIFGGPGEPYVESRGTKVP